MADAIHDSARPELDSIFERRETLSSGIRLRGDEDNGLAPAFVLPLLQHDASESAAA